MAMASLNVRPHKLMDSCSWLSDLLDNKLAMKGLQKKTIYF